MNKVNRYKSPKFPGIKILNFRTIIVIGSLIVTLLLWELFVKVGQFPKFILPPPSLVMEKFLLSVQNGDLLRHSLFTLSEVIAGLLLGLVVATVMGYFLAKSPIVEKFLSPYIVASQAVPIVAIAPLLVIWFGPGITSKVLICALIVFLPILINTIVGVRSVPNDLHDLMRSLQATWWQHLTKLEIPAALPMFLGGLRIGATLAVIGAVVGEFIGADRGLGFMINRARGQYDTSLVFVSVIALVLMALSLYGIVTLLESKLLKWRKKPA